MMALRDSQVFHRRTVEFEEGGIHFVVDPDAPNWVATDRRGSSILSMVGEALPVAGIVRRYGVENGLDSAKAWLHVHSFLREALRARIISPAAIEREPYAGR